MRARVADAPLLFFGVVIGVAIAFKLAVGWALPGASKEPEPPVAFRADPSAAPLAAASPTSSASEIPVVAAAAPTPGEGAPPPRMPSHRQPRKHHH